MVENGGKVLRDNKEQVGDNRSPYRTPLVGEIHLEGLLLIMK